MTREVTLKEAQRLLGRARSNDHHATAAGDDRRWGDVFSEMDDSLRALEAAQAILGAHVAVVRARREAALLRHNGIDPEEAWS